MVARVYQDGKYCESVECKSFVTEKSGIFLHKENDYNSMIAYVPNTMMVIFDDSGEPDYLKIGKDLKEKQS